MTTTDTTNKNTAFFEALHQTEPTQVQSNSTGFMSVGNIKNLNNTVNPIENSDSSNYVTDTTNKNTAFFEALHQSNSAETQIIEKDGILYKAVGDIELIPDLGTAQADSLKNFLNELIEKDIIEVKNMDTLVEHIKDYYAQEDEDEDAVQKLLTELCLESDCTSIEELQKLDTNDFDEYLTKACINLQSSGIQLSDEDIEIVLNKIFL